MVDMVGDEAICFVLERLAVCVCVHVCAVFSQQRDSLGAAYLHLSPSKPGGSRFADRCHLCQIYGQQGGQTMRYEAAKVALLQSV